MAELDELRTEVSGLRELIRMADSDTMETKDPLKHQAQLMMALREVQNGANATLGEQGRLEGVEGRFEGAEGRLEGAEGRLVGLNQNITAIMRHLGI
jgi:hypothetical protein